MLDVLDLRFQVGPAIMREVEENSLKSEVLTIDLVMLFRNLRLDFAKMLI